MSTEYIISIIGPFNILNKDTFQIDNLKCIDKNKVKINGLINKNYTYTHPNNKIMETIKEIKKIIDKINNKSLFIDGLFILEKSDEDYNCETIYASELALKTWIVPKQVDNYRNKVKNYCDEFENIYQLITN